jgi:NAD(P)-dependent dehydrogenase (short-subunit alcohol dehydrogenase family)
MSDSPRVALVVGVGPGLGEAVARRLASDGFTVAVASRNGDRLEDLAHELGGLAVSIDVRDPDSLHAGLDRVHAELGPVHTVCWNVGSGVFGDLDKVDVDALDLAFETNARGLFLLARRLAGPMAERGGGNLIITGATASLRGKPFTTAFAAGKAAQRSLAQSLARQLWPKGIHVALLIVDGMVDLPRTRRSMPDRPDEDFVSPAGYAEAVSFLVHQRRAAWTFELDIRPHVEGW